MKVKYEEMVVKIYACSEKKYHLKYLLIKHMFHCLLVILDN